MLRKFAVALIAATMFTAPVLAQGSTVTPPASSQPAKSEPAKTEVPSVKTVKAVKHVKTHARLHTRHIKHVRHAKAAKHVTKHVTMKKHARAHAQAKRPHVARIANARQLSCRAVASCEFEPWGAGHVAGLLPSMDRRQHTANRSP